MYRQYDFLNNNFIFICLNRTIGRLCQHPSPPFVVVVNFGCLGPNIKYMDQLEEKVNHIWTKHQRHLIILPFHPTHQPKHSQATNNQTLTPSGIQAVIHTYCMMGRESSTLQAMAIKAVTLKHYNRFHKTMIAIYELYVVKFPQKLYKWKS